MLEKLLTLKLPPGLYRNGTKYQSLGRWYDSHLVRFSNGQIRPVGGWTHVKDTNGDDLTALTGKPRSILAWRANNGVSRLAAGTSSNLYAVVDGVLTDITPAAFAAGQDDGAPLGSGNYGSGYYGIGRYGGGAATGTILDADTWQMDNYGEYLVACPTSDGTLYWWDGDELNDAVAISGAPTGCRAVVVTPERIVVALGASGDPRTVQWSNQEADLTLSSEWTPGADNYAGSYPLTTLGRLMAGRRTRRQTLLWTDTDVHTMSFIGQPFVYSFEQAGDNCGLIGPNAVAMAGSLAFWMSHNGFFVFDGFAKPLPCDVQDYVFGDLTALQRAKITATTIAAHNEVWWFYPSLGSLENDRYVVYNYAENHWTTGQLGRAAAIDRGAFQSPLMLTDDGHLYEHESGSDRGDEVPFLESGPIELGDGDQVMRVQRIVPDEKTVGDMQASLYSLFYPTPTTARPEAQTTPQTLTNPTDVRLTARFVRLRLDQGTETDWRVGKFSLGVRPQGRR